MPVRPTVDPDELDQDDDRSDEPEHAPQLAGVPDVERAQRSPRNDVAPAADRRAVDERQTAVVADAGKPEQTQIAARTLGEQPARRPGLEDRDEAEPLLEALGAQDRVVEELGVAQVEDDDADRRDEAEQTDREQLRVVDFP